MTIGKFFRLSLYSIIAFILMAAIIGYYMQILPISFGIHSKVYKSAGVAIDGYDVVNYFDKKSVNKGDVIFHYKLNDDTWFFTSALHLRMFKTKPSKYIPQFGGYCVYSISQGYTRPPDPKSWLLEKGKLYLFADEESKQAALADWKNVLRNAILNWK